MAGLSRLDAKYSCALEDATKGDGTVTCTATPEDPLGYDGVPALATGVTQVTIRANYEVGSKSIDSDWKVAGDTGCVVTITKNSLMGADAEAFKKDNTQAKASSASFIKTLGCHPENALTAEEIARNNQINDLQTQYNNEAQADREQFIIDNLTPEGLGVDADGNVVESNTQ